MVDVMGGAATPLPSERPSDNGSRNLLCDRGAVITMDSHSKALDELGAILRTAPDASDALAAVRSLLAQKPLKFLITTVEGSFAFDAPDSFSITKFVAEPSDLLLQVMTAARAADWQKIIILIHEALAPTSVA